MSKQKRQYIGILSAIAAYYTVHEGAHFLTALYYGVFRQVNFMGLGMQIDVYADRLTPYQLGVFCLVGAVATFFAGWLLIFSAKRICRCENKLLKAVAWYVSIAMLLLDPVYLSVLCGFFGGGDMNGIRLILPELAVRTAFGAVGILHGLLLWKYLLPLYTKAFREESA